MALDVDAFKSSDGPRVTLRQCLRTILRLLVDIDGLVIAQERPFAAVYSLAEFLIDFLLNFLEYLQVHSCVFVILPCYQMVRQQLYL